MTMHRLVASILGGLLIAGCGGSSSSEEVLPNGAGDAHAYTELYLRQHPRAVLRTSHLLVADVAPGDGPDRFAYWLDGPSRLTLEADPDVDVVQTLVLRDARGVEVARSGAGPASLSRGRHVLEIHTRADATADDRRTVFIRPSSLPDGSVVLRASGNCINCDFDSSQLDQQDFDGVDLSGSSFQMANISDCTFHGATMVNCFLNGEVLPTEISGSDFTGANLTGSNFDFANVGGLTVFGGPQPTPAANLSNTSWGGVLYTDDLYVVGLLEGVIFANTNLTGARFTGAMIIAADFRGADLSGSDFTASGPLETGGPRQTQCESCDFTVEPSTGNATRLHDAILAQAGREPFLIATGNSLSGADLSGAQLPGGAFAGLDFSAANFTQANLAGASFTGSSFAGANLAGADFSGAVLDGAVLRGAAFGGANFDGASIQGVDLFEQDLHGLSFRGATLRASVLDYADLSGADLSGAMLGEPIGSTREPASLIRAYMPNVDLTSADLRGVDLTGAHLYGDPSTTLLNQALLDGATLVDAICSGAKFTQASLAGAVLDGAQLVNCTFVEADLTGASLDSTYLQGADFAAAASVDGVRLSNAAVATTAGSWTFTEQNGMPYEYPFGATDLGGIATQTDVICPDGEPGPCTGAKLDPLMNGPFPPIPTCVPQPPTYNNCTKPSPPPTPTPPP